MNNYLIYKATSPSGKFYIGMTKKSLEERRKEHEWHSKGNKNKKIFYFAMKKYSLNFSWDVLESGLTKKEAEKKEIAYILQFNTTDRRFGYNQAKGGLSGDIMSEESRTKWHKSMKKYYNDPKWIESLKSKLTLLDSKSAKELADTYFSNIQNREKHSEIKGGKTFICIETGETFKSQTIAAEKLKLQQQNICKVLKKKRKQTGGYTFRYIGD